MIKKSAFVRSLQSGEFGLGPYEVSQRLRVQAGCFSMYQADPELDIRHYRGYMIRFSEKPDRTAENPELYTCVISTNQIKQWQDLVWTKEILGVLDAYWHRTHDKSSLGQMMDSRSVTNLPLLTGPANVSADLNGLTLALGCMIPAAYRQSLRDQDYAGRHEIAVLQGTLGVPAEFIDKLLKPEFEDAFEDALACCDV